MIAHLALLATAWVTSAADLVAHPREATILDARGSKAFSAGHIPGAQHVDWKDYRDGWLFTGKLPKNLDEVAAAFGQLGVDGGRPVVVCGDARDGWGEEGRIAWLLRYIGHPDASILDGGMAAWIAAGGVPTKDAATPAPGRFQAHVVPTLRASISDVARAVTTPSGAAVLDVRSIEEWNGATPYHESRGGHVPGARHVAWTDLLDAAGKALPAATVNDLLARAGVDANAEVITYCTGGVRSAEALVVLSSAGRRVRNYDGSWYEWSADESRPAALDRKKDAR
ncbi:MAG: rhodanese-like domain-containing protein [Acidobacteriota bacterium]